MDNLIVYEKIIRWLPENIDPKFAENWLGNKLLYPATLPQTGEELFLELALARERLRPLVADLAAVSWPEVFENLRRITRNDGELLGVILDGIEPAGVMAVGDIATIIAPSGSPAGLKGTAAEVTVETGSEKKKYTVAPDEIFVIPAGKETTAKVTVKFSGNLRIDKKDKMTVEINGGKVGIVIDTRGRPLTLTGESADRERIRKWQKALS